MAYSVGFNGLNYSILYTYLTLKNEEIHNYLLRALKMLYIVRRIAMVLAIQAGFSLLAEAQLYYITDSFNVNCVS